MSKSQVWNYMIFGEALRSLLPCQSEPLPPGWHMPVWFLCLSYEAHWVWRVHFSRSRKHRIAYFECDSSGLCTETALASSSNHPAPHVSDFHRTFDGVLPPAYSKYVWISSACSKPRLLETSDRLFLLASSSLCQFWSEVLKFSSLGVMSYFQTWTQISSLKTTVLKIAVDSCIPPLSQHYISSQRRQRVLLMDWGLCL